MAQLLPRRRGRVPALGLHLALVPRDPRPAQLRGRLRDEPRGRPRRDAGGPCPGRAGQPVPGALPIPRTRRSQPLAADAARSSRHRGGHGDLRIPGRNGDPHAAAAGGLAPGTRAGPRRDHDPGTVRLVTASLMGFDRTVEEAAQNLGAGPWTTFRRVTMPLIRPGVVAAALFGFVISFGNLEMTLFLIGPGRTTLPIAILQYLEWRIDPIIAAMSLLQILVIGAAMVATDRYVKLARVL